MILNYAYIQNEFLYKLILISLIILFVLMMQLDYIVMEISQQVSSIHGNINFQTICYIILYYMTNVKREKKNTEREYIIIIIIVIN